jgi:hypothetical protein
MKLLRSALAVLAAHLLLAGALAAQTVYVVDPAGGGDFTTVQPAVDAAADGDVLIVLAKPGAGEIDNAVEIADKSLVILGILPTTFIQPQIGSLAVVGLSAGKSVIVRGIRMQSSFDATGCEGVVLLEDCAVASGAVAFGTTPTSVIQQSSHVVFARCSIDGANGLGSGTTAATGGPGLVVEDSTVALYDCLVTGGSGGYAQFFGEFLFNFPTVGGQGLQIWSGTVFASGSDIQGGQGGAGAQSQSGATCAAPTKGGSGVRNYGHLIRLDTSITGGLPGTAPPCASPAEQGPDVLLLDDGSVSELPELGRSLEISSPVEADGLCNISVSGQPGDNVVLLQSFAPFGQLHAGLKGVLAGQPPYFTFLLGTLGPGGTLSFPVHIPPGPLPGGLEAITLIEQVLTGANSGGGLLSSPSVVTLVNDLP